MHGIDAITSHFISKERIFENKILRNCKHCLLLGLSNAQKPSRLYTFELKWAEQAHNYC